MTWSERMKLAWTTFKREAFPLYTWTFIFIAIGIVLVVGMTVGVIRRLDWALPQTYGGSFSPGMPVPGIPPTVTPLAGPFGAPSNLFGAFSGPFSNFSTLLTAFGNVAGIFLLILLVGWLIGSAFYTGIFNLTTKAYREKATFKDFRLSGFFRILGWQVLIFLINLVFLGICLIGILALRNSQGLLVAFLIVYALFMIAIGIFVLPWLNTSAIYLLAHPNEGFWRTFTDSWRFFRRHMGSLWGYIGTVILIQIALQLLSRISYGIGGLAALVVSPFIAVLAIVWVLSLVEGEPERVIATPEDIVSPATSDSQTFVVPAPEQALPKVPTPVPSEPKINLQKGALPPAALDDIPHFCPSCGKANTGTAYCPQCGTKL